MTTTVFEKLDMAAWRNGIASDYELIYQEIAGSSPAVVIFFIWLISYILKSGGLFYRVVNIHSDNHRVCGMYANEFCA